MHLAAWSPRKSAVGLCLMRCLVIDNYDSFTYNLVQYLGELGADPVVIRSDEMTPDEARQFEAERLVISPGPGRPEQAGYSIEFVRTLGMEMPTLGVCLGHQAIVVAFGGKVDLAPEPKHGKTSMVRHDGEGLFSGLSQPFTATRYHSLAVCEMPDSLIATAWSVEDDVIQGLRHESLPITGVQFHPESVLTTEGKALLKNFLAD